ncbi:MAG: FkbM family methyltransferase [Pseudomonadales bacterium]
MQRERYRLHNVHEAEEEALFLELLSELEPGGTFVNIGAAIGYYMILAALKRPDIQIIGYEPLRRHRARIRQNAKLNGISRGRFRIYPEGVDARAGVADFAVLDFSSMITRPRRHGRLSRLRGWLENTRIRTVTLEEVLDRAGGQADLVQMDIQGLERPVLESSERLLAKGSIRRLLVGTHSVEIHQAVRRAAERAGYHIRHDLAQPESQPDGILLAVRLD